jgi:hypothetical protein
LTLNLRGGEALAMRTFRFSVKYPDVAVRSAVDRSLLDAC